MTTRRGFFSTLAGLFIGISGFSACSKDEASDTSVIDQNQLKAFVDTIVPKDQDAGAVEAGVVNQLLEHFRKNPEAERKAQAMLKDIDELSSGIFHASFKHCNLVQRELILDVITKSSDKKLHPARITLLGLRSRIITAFYNSTAGWKMLAYSAPYPGGYPDFNAPPPD